MTDFSTKGYVFVTCAGGVEPYLEREIRALGHKPETVRPLGVALRASLADCMRLNLHLRTAHRVLFEIARFKAYDADELYAELSRLPWEDIVPPDGYLSVVSSVDNPSIRDSRFANLRVKDAVVDRLQDKFGRRPDSGPDRTGVVLSLHWQGRKASLSLDTTGDPLSNRGYRQLPHLAPMRETIAAACLMASDYDGKGHLVDPMCGSGTFSVEAALMATGTAPGLLREHFAFTRLTGFDPGPWKALRDEARAAVRDTTAHPMLASDADPEAVSAARHNAGMAGMDRFIEFRVHDFRAAHVPAPASRQTNLCIVNPEYGLRLGDEDALAPLYSGMGDFFKNHCQGYVGGIFTGNPRLAKRVGLKPRIRIPLMNGPIECRLLLYDIYSGSRRG